MIIEKPTGKNKEQTTIAAFPINGAHFVNVEIRQRPENETADVRITFANILNGTAASISASGTDINDLKKVLGSISEILPTVKPAQL